MTQLLNELQTFESLRKMISGSADANIAEAKSYEGKTQKKKGNLKPKKAIKKKKANKQSQAQNNK